MTTSHQWTDLVEWVTDKFVDTQWTPEQAVECFYDLEGFDVADIWAALYRLYETGQRTAPDSKQLAAEVREQARADAKVGYNDEVPVVVGWGAYSMKRFGEVLTPTGTVERIHMERGPCATSTCDICHTKDGQ